MRIAMALAATNMMTTIMTTIGLMPSTLTRWYIAVELPCSAVLFRCNSKHLEAALGVVLSARGGINTFLRTLVPNLAVGKGVGRNSTCPR
eukprot:1696556-Prymnesium_polylepis.1